MGTVERTVVQNKKGEEGEGNGYCSELKGKEGERGWSKGEEFGTVVQWEVRKGRGGELALLFSRWGRGVEIHCNSS